MTTNDCMIGARVAVVLETRTIGWDKRGRAETLHLFPKDEGLVLGFSSPKRNMIFDVAWDRYPGYISHSQLDLFDILEGEPLRHG